MRVFIAIQFDPEIKNYLKEIQNMLKTYALRGNFTLLNNLHLTLKFIGEVSISKLDEIKRAMDMTVNRFPNFRLYLGKLGNFCRRTGNGDIVWVSVEGDLLKLNMLHDKLENHLECRGIVRDSKPFRPHITLAREVRFVEPFYKVCDYVTVARKKIDVQEIFLMESRREEGRLVYIPLYAHKFKN